MKPTELNLSGMSALVVKAKGDGRTFWMDLRVADQMAASSYRAYLPTTAGESKEIRVPFTDFKLQAFGRELPLKPIEPSAVASAGFTLADKKSGPFEFGNPVRGGRRWRNPERRNHCGGCQSRWRIHDAPGCCDVDVGGVTAHADGG